MKHPIPYPKKMTYTGKTVPATFLAEPFDALFAPAYRVFSQYARQAFGNIVDSGALTLVLDETLGDGYRLSVGEKTVLSAANNTGMNYAFATLLQLVEVVDGNAVFPECEIADKPDSQWRGVMLDLARCYHEMEHLYAVADLCWLLKINRLQLHFTDDCAVRFPFISVPKAVSKKHHTKQELAEFAAYCKERGIVIVPEIDAPGHFWAFSKAYPALFGLKPDGLQGEEGNLSSIMRVDSSVFDTLKAMYAEIAEVFPDSPWIHIGGDEAAVTQWGNCAVSEDYRKEQGLRDVHEMYGHCVAKLAQMILDMGRIPAVWEGFDEQCNDMIPKNTLVFAWESMYQLAPSLLAGGFEVVNASWQPLYIVTERRMWEAEEILKWEKNVWRNWNRKSAAFEKPIVVPKSSAIAGGQLCAWGDAMRPEIAFAPRREMLRREFANLYERAPAFAQKVWTSYDSPDWEPFRKNMAQLDELCRQRLHIEV